MGTRVRFADAEFELDFELPQEEALPPGMERVQNTSGEEEEAWSADVPPALVAYARELAISADQVAHWVEFFTRNPQGRLAWAEIRNLWKPGRRRRCTRG